MCGIYGSFQPKAGISATLNLGAPLAKLAPRGPDDEGEWRDHRIALGHRRLRVMDKSSDSNQPMIDSTKGLSLVFNGAIYNYPEIRKELTAAGYHFQTTVGDTEVILKAYQRWGDSFVDKLNGMFAIAIYEHNTGELFLARDRLGIKPLYFTELNGGAGQANGELRFASSLPALLAGGGISHELDPIALNYYMSFHSVVPAPHTILKQVRKLPPAHTWRIKPDGTGEPQQYWQPHYGTTEGISEVEWQEQLLDTMRKSVSRRLVSDVPVGVLLSGGVDSSLLTGLMAETGHQNLNTFSIGFDTVGDELGDEFQYSDIVAKEFGTKHHKIHIDESRLLPALPEAVSAMSEPMVSHDAVAFYLLSQEVSKHLKVVQSGQGADEVFAGYHWYPPLLQAQHGFEDYRKLFFDTDHQGFKETVANHFHGEDYASNYVQNHFNLAGADTAIDRGLRLDSHIMLVDDPVKRIDNMTMAHGLEARVPFIDHEVVELAAKMPGELKARNGGKHILKEASRQVIPAAVIDRPKGYFPVPALKYLRGPYLDLVKNILNEPAAKQRGLYQPKTVERLLKDPESHITPLRGSRLWQLALLEFWLQRQGISA